MTHINIQAANWEGIVADMVRYPMINSIWSVLRRLLLALINKFFAQNRMNSNLNQTYAFSFDQKFFLWYDHLNIIAEKHKCTALSKVCMRKLKIHTELKLSSRQTNKYKNKWTTQTDDLSQEVKPVGKIF